MILKQFVPSTVCLKCDGCCRYKEADSVWRPKLGDADRKDLGVLITQEDLTQDGHLKTFATHSCYVCRCLNKDNTCKVYAQRPFECRLYPFILSQTQDGLKMYVHLSCPFVQEHHPSKEFDDYVAYLKDFFRREDVQNFLDSNRGMFHDYSAYALELLYLYTL